MVVRSYLDELVKVVFSGEMVFGVIVVVAAVVATVSSVLVPPCVKV